MSGADTPLVSCIMPTKDRRAFAARAIDYFCRQDYPNRELVIVDDGRDRIADLAKVDDRIRYFELDRRLTIGAKRNLACERANGSLIAHWDDDDWHATDRLSRQVASLRESGADVSGTARLLFYDVGRQRAYEYVYPATGRRWLAGGTLMYRRELWRTRPFPNLDVGEDGAFVAAARGTKFAVVPDPPFYVATIHSGNTSPKQTGGSAWKPYPEERLRALLVDDWAAVAMAPMAAPAASHVPAVDRRATGDAADRVTVSIPCYRVRPYLRQAVESILAQTHRNLRLVVVNDGDPDAPWDLLDHIDDLRLVRFDLPTNRGPYFADGVVLEATPDPWFMVQDADDWSEPGRTAALLRASLDSGALGAVSAGMIHGSSDAPEGARPDDNFPRRGQPLTGDNDHRLNIWGLFRTEAVRAIGGTYGAERFGYDTIIGNFLLMMGSIAYVDRPLYHRRIRPDSLSNSPETGLQSPARARVWRRLFSLYRPAYEAYLEHRAGRLNLEALADRLRRIRDEHVTTSEQQALAQEAGRLRGLLEAQDRRWATEPALSEPRPLASPGTWTDARARGIATDRRLQWDAQTVTPALVAALANRLADRRPRRILEVGSGNSTAVLAAHAAVTGTFVTSLEHDPARWDATARLLGRLGLRDRVDFRLLPTGKGPEPDGGELPLYDVTLGDGYDFVFVGGPPQRIGRDGVLHGIAPHLAEEWELWLDGGHQAHELACFERWRARVAFEGSLYEIDRKGVWVLHQPGSRHPPLDAPITSRLPAPAASVGRGPAASSLALAAGTATTTETDATPAIEPEQPLVTAIMPTYDRRAFVRRAVDLLLRQTYPNLELVIVDDGTDPVGDLLPADPRIRYLRLEGRRTIGAKRNAACEAARGEIVIGWDDDDWYAPDRIARQVAPILAGRADATGLAETLMLDLASGRYWRCASRLGDRIFEGGVVSGTLAFRRLLWAQGTRFPDASLAEDAAFQRALVRRGSRLLRMPDEDLFIYVRHGANSWRFTPGSYVDRASWRVVPAPAFLAPEDLAAFRELRQAVATARPGSSHSAVPQTYRRATVAIRGATSRRWTGR